MNAWERSQREEDRQHHQHRRKTPSFSSSLLDAIYRSIDDSKCEEEQAGEEAVLYRDTTATRTKKQRSSNNANLVKRNNALLDDEESLRRAIMIEKWMESENRTRTRTEVTRSSRMYNSTSSSSDSSCGGVFSSSETESGYRERSKSASFTVQRPKQVRSCGGGGGCGGSVRSEFEQTPKREGRLTRTKSKALKIYGDLKKVKQPISPGRRITNFLNSIFNSRNVKNAAKREAAMMMEDSSSVRRSRSVKDTTTCSLSSSFSRSSCLSKPPSSRSKSKRSVRFYPVTVIVDEDSRPCGHKCIYGDDPSLMPTPVLGKISETTTMKNKNAYQLRDFQDDIDDEEEEDEDEDDCMSCASSDLFELDNIGAIGVGAYREELPVYGTTSLKTHHHHLAIAKGLIR
ncbi:Protein BIG GRAIN 1-like A [Camellia lanceoleosa]|uniref:Protein BIG GRAIN 1-like A n=1 Tax=Camellia lanceoleosa TaxID=1840588 RepID=A0ACC0FJF4_9ERIC|nr:Protein BIG GRAIN 1-like A [Camellia lanceoleosa]